MTATSAPTALGSGPREEALALFAFRLGTDLYLLAVEHLVAVIATEPPTPLPRVPPHVLGIVNHDHRALPVLDLAHVLRRPTAAGPSGEGSPRTLVVRAGGHTVGLPVSAALGVVHVAASDVQPASGAFGPHVEGLARGECPSRHGVGAWLDLPRLLEAARV